MAITHRQAAARCLYLLYVSTPIAFHDAGNHVISRLWDSSFATSTTHSIRDDGFVLQPYASCDQIMPSDYNKDLQHSETRNAASQTETGGEFLRLIRLIQQVSDDLYNSEDHTDNNPLSELCFTLLLALITALDYNQPKYDPDIGKKGRFNRFIAGAILQQLYSSNASDATLAGVVQSLTAMGIVRELSSLRLSISERPNVSEKQDMIAGAPRLFWKHTGVQGVVQMSVGLFFYSLFRVEDDYSAELSSCIAPSARDTTVVSATQSRETSPLLTETDNAAKYPQSFVLAGPPGLHLPSKESISLEMKLIIHRLLRDAFSVHSRSITLLSRFVASNSFVNSPLFLPSASTSTTSIAEAVRSEVGCTEKPFPWSPIQLLHNMINEIIRIDNSPSFAENIRGASRKLILRSRAVSAVDLFAESNSSLVPPYRSSQLTRDKAQYVLYPASTDVHIAPFFIQLTNMDSPTPSVSTSTQYTSALSVGIRNVHAQWSLPDCIEDVLVLLGILVRAQPSLACRYWSRRGSFLADAYLPLTHFQPVRDTASSNVLFSESELDAIETNRSIVSADLYGEGKTQKPMRLLRNDDPGVGFGLLASKSRTELDSYAFVRRVAQLLADDVQRVTQRHATLYSQHSSNHYLFFQQGIDALLGEHSSTTSGLEEWDHELIIAAPENWPLQQRGTEEANPESIVSSVLSTTKNGDVDKSSSRGIDSSYIFADNESDKKTQISARQAFLVCSRFFLSSYLDFLAIIGSGENPLCADENSPTNTISCAQHALKFLGIENTATQADALVSHGSTVSDQLIVPNSAIPSGLSDLPVIANLEGILSLSAIAACEIDPEQIAARENLYLSELSAWQQRHGGAGESPVGGLFPRGIGVRGGLGIGIGRDLHDPRPVSPELRRPSVTLICSSLRLISALCVDPLVRDIVASLDIEKPKRICNNEDETASRFSLHEMDRARIKLIPSLFHLLRTPTDMRVKAYVMHSLSRIATASEAFALQIRDSLEASQILSTQSDSTANTNQKNLYSRLLPVSLHEEHENKEAKEKYYFGTLAFIDLLRVINSQVPLNSMGLKLRSPGILPHINFLMKSVLEKARYRQVASNLPGDTWRLIYTPLSFFFDLLASYRVHEPISPECASMVTTACQMAGVGLRTSSSFPEDAISQVPTTLPGLIDAANVNTDALNRTWFLYALVVQGGVPLSYKDATTSIMNTLGNKYDIRLATVPEVTYHLTHPSQEFSTENRDASVAFSNTSFRAWTLEGILTYFSGQAAGGIYASRLQKSQSIEPISGDSARCVWILSRGTLSQQDYLGIKVLLEVPVLSTAKVVEASSGYEPGDPRFDFAPVLPPTMVLSSAGSKNTRAFFDEPSVLISTRNESPRSAPFEVLRQLLWGGDFFRVIADVIRQTGADADLDIIDVSIDYYYDVNARKKALSAAKENPVSARGTEGLERTMDGTRYAFSSEAIARRAAWSALEHLEPKFDPRVRGAQDAPVERKDVKDKRIARAERLAADISMASIHSAFIGEVPGFDNEAAWREKALLVSLCFLDAALARDHAFLKGVQSIRVKEPLESLAKLVVNNGLVPYIVRAIGYKHDPRIGIVASRIMYRLSIIRSAEVPQSLLVRELSLSHSHVGKRYNSVLAKILQGKRREGGAGAPLDILRAIARIIDPSDHMGDDWSDLECVAKLRTYRRLYEDHFSQRLDPNASNSFSEKVDSFLGDTVDEKIFSSMATVYVNTVENCIPGINKEIIVSGVSMPFSVHNGIFSAANSSSWGVPFRDSGREAIRLAMVKRLNILLELLTASIEAVMDTSGSTSVGSWILGWGIDGSSWSRDAVDHAIHNSPRTVLWALTQILCIPDILLSRVRIGEQVSRLTYTLMRNKYTASEFSIWLRQSRMMKNVGVFGEYMKRQFFPWVLLSLPHALPEPDSSTLPQSLQADVLKLDQNTTLVPYASTIGKLGKAASAPLAIDESILYLDVRRSRTVSFRNLIANLKSCIATDIFSLSTTSDVHTQGNAWTLRDIGNLLLNALPDHVNYALGHKPSTESYLLNHLHYLPLRERGPGIIPVHLSDALNHFRIYGLSTPSKSGDSVNKRYRLPLGGVSSTVVPALGITITIGGIELQLYNLTILRALLLQFDKFHGTMHSVYASTLLKESEESLRWASAHNSYLLSLSAAYRQVSAFCTLFSLIIRKIIPDPDPEIANQVVPVDVQLSRLKSLLVFAQLLLDTLAKASASARNAMYGDSATSILLTPIVDTLLSVFVKIHESLPSVRIDGATMKSIIIQLGTLSAFYTIDRVPGDQIDSVASVGLRRSLHACVLFLIHYAFQGCMPPLDAALELFPSSLSNVGIPNINAGVQASQDQTDICQVGLLQGLLEIGCSLLAEATRDGCDPSYDRLTRLTHLTLIARIFFNPSVVETTENRSLSPAVLDLVRKLHEHLITKGNANDVVSALILAVKEIDSAEAQVLPIGPPTSSENGMDQQMSSDLRFVETTEQSGIKKMRLVGSVVSTAPKQDLKYLGNTILTVLSTKDIDSVICALFDATRAIISCMDGGALMQTLSDELCFMMWNITSPTRAILGFQDIRAQLVGLSTTNTNIHERLASACTSVAPRLSFLIFIWRSLLQYRIQNVSFALNVLQWLTKYNPLIEIVYQCVLSDHITRESLVLATSLVDLFLLIVNVEGIHDALASIEGSGDATSLLSLSHMDNLVLRLFQRFAIQPRALMYKNEQEQFMAPVPRYKKADNSWLKYMTPSASRRDRIGGTSSEQTSSESNAASILLGEKLMCSVARYCAARTYNSLVTQLSGRVDISVQNSNVQVASRPTILFHSPSQSLLGMISLLFLDILQYFFLINHFYSCRVHRIESYPHHSVTVGKHSPFSIRCNLWLQCSV